jgi:DNA polymerase-1
LTPYLKEEGTTTASKSNDNDDSSKSPNKSEDQFDLFGSGVSDESSEENHHKYYKTLQDTEHSYQIIQGDLGLKLLLQTYQNKVCLF